MIKLNKKENCFYKDDTFYITGDKFQYALRNCNFDVKAPLCSIGVVKENALVNLFNEDYSNAMELLLTKEQIISNSELPDLYQINYGDITLYVRFSYFKRVIALLNPKKNDIIYIKHIKHKPLKIVVDNREALLPCLRQEDLNYDK